MRMTDPETLSLLQQRAAEVAHHVGPVRSPCISVCQMDAGTGLCFGCFRSIDEICNWSAMDDGGKREVWRLIDQRCAAA